MFSVYWTADALREVVRLWTDADSETRSRITATVREIDSMLSHQPDEVGESQGGIDGIAFFRPLAVRFRVFLDSREVDVGHVWWVPQRR